MPKDNDMTEVQINVLENICKLCNNVSQSDGRTFLARALPIVETVFAWSPAQPSSKLLLRCMLHCSRYCPRSEELKATQPETFSSPELLWKVYDLFDSYDFRLPIRRSIHDLFQECRSPALLDSWDAVRSPS